MNSKTQYFLLQVNDYGSTQILEHQMYEHKNWDDNKKNMAHGNVKPGDLILVYFTSTALFFKKTLKMIYKVKTITKNNIRFYLEIFDELNGLSYSFLQDLIQKNHFPGNFKKCIGGQGNNIVQITLSDFNYILDLDKKINNLGTIGSKNKRNRKSASPILDTSYDERTSFDDEKLSRYIESLPIEPKSKEELEQEILDLNNSIKKMAPKLKTSSARKTQYERFKVIVTKLKQYHTKCMICKVDHFKMNNDRLYSEVCHIIPFSASHNDTVENLMVLCPTCHKKFDNAKYPIRKSLYEKLCKNFPNKKFKKPDFL